MVNFGKIREAIFLEMFFFVLLGEFQLMYLFVRERLGWDVADFGDFSSYNWFIGVTGIAIYDIRET